MQTRSRSLTAHINDRAITVEPRETLLQAALRNGIDFPNSCRVGGCASCKCRVVDGQVKELTETAYLLSDSEVERGFVLACQTVPRTDVRVEVDLSQRRDRAVGRIVGKEQVTPDIARLTAQLEAPLAYQAGQFADVAIEGLDDVRRSYSFATPASADGVVRFFIRKVPGGRFSSLVNDGDVVGRTIRLDGPHGDFWLRPGDAPLVFVAGGSGLAPILAILRDAVARGVARPVTLLFGARTERDLYALDEIAAIALDWPAPFRFVPVLSAADDDATWTGARGLVTDELPGHLSADAHAYLCGPPAMIDAAIALITKSGVPREHIHFDRFTTQADAPLAAAPVAATATPWATLHYLKFFLFHGIGLVAAAAVLAGGARITAGLVAVLGAYIIGDAIGGDDTSTPHFAHPGILTAQLWLALPLLAAILFCAVWSVSPGDPLSFGAWLTQLTGYDVLAARAATTWPHQLSTVILAGLMIGMVGTIPAHELTHRTWDRASMLIGRWLLAFSFDTTFAIEHVYGHHRYVATTEDPATAPRGRNVYWHVVASTVRGNVSAWRIERGRLHRRGRAVWSWHNAFLRGHLMSVVLVALAGWLGGWRGAAFFVACALWGKALLEIVNYMEHYGMVRNPATPVQPRHSWNTNRRVSSWAMFNLTRHSHHHAAGEVPYHELRPMPDAPMMINGYLTTLVIALIPPLWHALMTPKVLAWDRTFASEEERRLADRANAVSGIRDLERAPRAGGLQLDH